MYLLDTNVISELRRPQPHGAVVAWLRGIPDADLHLSAVAIGELQAGVEITREQDRDKALAIETWIDQVADTYNVLPMDAQTFRLLGADLPHRRSNALFEDVMIAATAKTHNLTLATRNVRDFEPCGIATLNPCTGGDLSVQTLTLLSAERRGRGNERTIGLMMSGLVSGAIWPPSAISR